MIKILKYDAAVNGAIIKVKKKKKKDCTSSSCVHCLIAASVIFLSVVTQTLVSDTH